jgi:hypothetical protein
LASVNQCNLTQLINQKIPAELGTNWNKCNDIPASWLD